MYRQIFHSQYDLTIYGTCSVLTHYGGGVSLSFRSGHLPVVRYLLEDRQCDVNVTDEDGQVPLHFSCE